MEERSWELSSSDSGIARERTEEKKKKVVLFSFLLLEIGAGTKSAVLHRPFELSYKIILSIAPCCRSSLLSLSCLPITDDKDCAVAAQTQRYRDHILLGVGLWQDKTCGQWCIAVCSCSWLQTVRTCVEVLEEYSMIRRAYPIFPRSFHVALTTRFQAPLESSCAALY